MKVANSKIKMKCILNTIPKIKLLKRFIAKGLVIQVANLMINFLKVLSKLYKLRF